MGAIYFAAECLEDRTLDQQTNDDVLNTRLHLIPACDFLLCSNQWDWNE